MLGIVDLSLLSARSTEWVTVLVDASVKAMAVLLVAIFLRIALRRAPASARYLVWCLALGSAVALPIVSAIYPVWNLAVLPRVEFGDTVKFAPLLPGEGKQELSSPPIGAMPARTGVRNPEVTSPEATAEVPPSATKLTPVAATGVKTAQRSASPHWSLFLLMVWAIGALIILARYLIGTVRIAYLVRRAKGISPNHGSTVLRQVATELELACRIRLLGSDGMNVPLTWGCLRPVVLLPGKAEQWSEERLRIVLLHERAHVQRRDCLTQMLSQIACAIYWFNPLAWLAACELRIERERACDDRVLSNGSKPSEYAGHLLEIVRALHGKRCFSFAAVPMAHLPRIEKRLRAILDRNRNRRGLTRLAILVALLTVAGIVLPLGMTRLTATAQDKPQAKMAESKRLISTVQSLEKKLEFDKEIPLGLKAGKRPVGDRDHWAVELLGAKFSRATILLTLGSKDQIQAILRVKTSSVLEAKWRMSVELLDNQEKSLARAEHVFETMFAVQYDHVQTALGQLDFSLGPVDRIAEFAKFRVAISQAPDDADVTIDPVAAAGNVVAGATPPPEAVPAAPVSFEGRLEFEKKIPLPAQIRAGKQLLGEREYFAVRADWAQFFRAGEQVSGTLHVKTTWVQAARWRLRLGLLTEDGQVLVEDQPIIETHLMINRYPNADEGCVSFSLGRWNDVSKATKFSLSIEQAAGDASVTAHLRPEGPIAWGKEVNGLRAGISFELGERGYHVGETVSFVFRVANVSSDPIHLSYTSPPFLGWSPIVTDQDGRRMAVNSPVYDIPVQLRERSLAPGETIILGSCGVHIRPPGWRGKIMEPVLFALAGRYRVNQPYRFQGLKPNDWVGELESGWLDLNIVAAEVQAIVIRGLDLTIAPCTTRFEELPDLFEARPPGSKSYHLRDEIVRFEIPSATGEWIEALDITGYLVPTHDSRQGMQIDSSSFPIGEVFHLPDKNVFYVQHDAAGASTLHYYGPFEGDPFQRMNLPRPRSEGGASLVPAPSPEVAQVEGRLEFDKVISLPAELRGGEHVIGDGKVFAVEGQSVEFTEASGLVRARLKTRTATVFDAGWRVTMSLLDDQGRVLGQGYARFKTILVMRGTFVRESMILHFFLGRSEDVSAAVRFRVSLAYDLRNLIPTAFDCFVDHLAFDREIPVVLIAGEKMIGEHEVYAVQGEWIQFTKESGRIEASLRVTTTSVLDARWRATLELMAADGRIVASSQADFATILAIRGWPATRSELLHFPLGNWEDISSARSFKIRVERVTEEKVPGT